MLTKQDPENQWQRHQKHFLWVVWGFLAISVINRLSKEFYRLLWVQGESGAVDLGVFAKAVKPWFSGVDVYHTIESAVYPPASYLMLYPFTGWLDFPSARVLWTIFTVVALVGLIYLTVRESKAETQSEKALVALLPLFYATRATIGNAQLGIALIPLLVGGLLIFRQKQRGWGKDLLATGMVTWGMIKPNLSIPFAWILLFAYPNQRFRPFILVSLLYGMLTLVASSFQPTHPLSLLLTWFERARSGAEWGASEGGYANQQTMINQINQLTTASGNSIKLSFSLTTPITLLFLIGLGVWIYYHRRVNLWLLLGVTGIIARVWTYHRQYDDIIMLLPTIAIYQIIKNHQRQGIKGGNWLLVLLFILAFVPSNILEASPPWSSLFVTFQSLAWLFMLIFLIREAWREKHEELKQGQ